MEGFMVLFAISGIAILVMLFLRVTSVDERVRWLERKLEGAVRENAPQQQPEAPPGQSVPPPAATPVRTEPPRAQATVPPSPPPVAIIPPAPPKVPSRTKEEFEAFVGGKLLNRIGALALVMGVGFFLKYAFDNNWINETMRVAIGLAAGIGVLLLGVRTEKKGFAIFAQGLFGAGISILYLSIYASFNFYHLVPQAAAFAVMSLVTMLGFAIAVRYDSLATSLLAWAGGFLTPFMLSTGNANEVGLFAYVFLLEAGLLALVVRKPSWNILAGLTLAGTYLVFFAWRFGYYHDDALGVTLFFLTAFWFLFLLFDLYQAMRQEISGALMRQAMNLLNACIYYAVLYDLIDGPHHPWMGATSLILSGIYLLQAVILRKWAANAAMIAQNLFLTLLLLVIATGIQYSGWTTIIFWSLEAAFLVWCAQRWESYNVALFAIGLFACAALKFASTSGTFGYLPLADYAPVLNYRALTYAAMAASVFAGAFMFRRTPEASVAKVVPWLDGAWIMVLVLFCTVEINDGYSQRAIAASMTEQNHLEFAKFLMMTSAWVVLSLPIVFFGLRGKLRSLIVPGLLIVTMSFWLAVIKGVAYSPIEYFSPILNVRVLALLVVAASMAVHCRWLERSASAIPWAPEVSGPIAIAAILVILTLLTGETRDLFELRIFRAHALGLGGSAEASQLENLKQLSLSGLWMFYGGLLMVVGLWRRKRGLRIAAIALLAVAILKIFIYDLSFLEALYRIFSFIGLGVILLAASYLYQRYKSIIIDDIANKDAGR